MYKILTVTLHGVTLGVEVGLNSSYSSLGWAAHNTLKGWTLYNLSEQDLRLILLSLSDAELRLTKICQKNDTHWVSVDRTTHARFFAGKDGYNKFVDQVGFPEFVTDLDAVIDTGYFIIKPNRIQHPRLHVRHDVKVTCVLIGSNNKQFHTESVDLSEGGLHFKDAIPSWISGYFLVVIKSNYQLMCSLVEDQKEKKRVQIVSEESDFNYIQYKNWLTTF